MSQLTDAIRLMRAGDQKGAQRLLRGIVGNEWNDNWYRPRDDNAYRPRAMGRKRSVGGPFSTFDPYRLGGFGDTADQFYGDDPGAWAAAFSQWAPTGPAFTSKLFGDIPRDSPDVSRNQRAWLQGQYGNVQQDFQTEANRRLLMGDKGAFEFTDYLDMLDPNKMYAAATPGEKGLFQGRYAPGVRYQSPW